MQGQFKRLCLSRLWQLLHIGPFPFFTTAFLYSFNKQSTFFSFSFKMLSFSRWFSIYFSRGLLNNNVVWSNGSNDSTFSQSNRFVRLRRGGSWVCFLWSFSFLGGRVDGLRSKSKFTDRFPRLWESELSPPCVVFAIGEFDWSTFSVILLKSAFSTERAHLNISIKLFSFDSSTKHALSSRYCSLNVVCGQKQITAW